MFVHVCLCYCSPLQPRTCANYNPITNPGERFECPADSEYNPKGDNKTTPDVATCCKVGSDCLFAVCGTGHCIAAKLSEL